MAHSNVDSIIMAVNSHNTALVTADTSGEMKTWLITGFCDGSEADDETEGRDKPGYYSNIVPTQVDRNGPIITQVDRN